MQTLAAVLLGVAFMAVHVNIQLAAVLPNALDNQKVLITGTVVSVPELTSEHKLKFIFKATDLGRIQLHWAAPKQNLNAGDQWSLLVKLKAPRNYANPGSFDSEKLLFQQRIIATGYVVSSSDNQLLQTSIFSEPLNKFRQYLTNIITANLGERSFIGIILALVLGSKALLDSTQWQILQNTGTAHLMAISGMHIGLIAGLAFLGVRIVWRFAPARWLHVPAPWLAAWGSLGLSFAYALLAGFSVSTQRSLIMIIVFLSGILLRRKISAWQRYCLALGIVLVWDPFVVLSAGFWLSFLAVGSLLYAFSGRQPNYRAWYNPWRWLQPQVVITIALLPVSLLFFGQNSIIAPLANLVAIPWVSFMVVPFGLCGTMLLPIFTGLGLQIISLAEYNFSLLWPFLEWCNQVPAYIWYPPQTYLGLRLVCAAAGVIWLLIPKGLPGRWWGWIGFIPLFIAPTVMLAPGQAEFTLLDVGQGLAAVVRTKSHVLVYDTGAKLSGNFDLGSRVVAPYLRAVGIKHIDTLMISHADNDHIGGAVSLLASLPVGSVLISDVNYLAQYSPIQCIAGQSWEWDEVKFTVLHPSLELRSKKRNDHSCVLMVQAGNQKILLTGDIETKSEKLLIASYGAQLHADLLLVPHHGSKTSSSVKFLEVVQPKYALIPAGYKNQYGHPKPEILERYQDLGIQILRTAQDGAISFLLGNNGADNLQPKCYRHQHRYFWSAS